MEPVEQLKQLLDLSRGRKNLSQQQPGLRNAELLLNAILKAGGDHDTTPAPPDEASALFWGQLHALHCLASNLPLPPHIRERLRIVDHDDDDEEEGQEEPLPAVPSNSPVGLLAPRCRPHHHHHTGSAPPPPPYPPPTHSFWCTAG